MPHPRAAAAAASATSLLVAAVLFATPSASGRVAGASARGPAPGAETSGDTLFPAHGNGGYDVRRYDVRLSWARATRRLSGTAQLTVLPTQSLSRLSLDLVPGMAVRSVRVDGARAVHDQAAVPGKLRITPATPLTEGEPAVVSVQYAGRPTTVRDPDGGVEGWLTSRSGDGAVALGQPVGTPSWLPVNDHLDDKALWDLRIEVPRGLRTAAHGRLAGRRTSADGRRTTWRWVSDRPVPPQLALVGIGRYDVRRDVLRGVGPDGSLPVLSLTDPREGTGGAAHRVLRRALPWLESRYGTYPWSTIGLLVDDVDPGYALETATRPFFPGEPDETTVVHELAHQWFGNAVTPDDWSAIWLSEGWATYAEWLWAEHRGHATAEQRFRSLYAQHDALDDFWDVPPAALDDPRDMYSPPIYHRSAMALHVLASTLGPDAWDEVGRRWVAEHLHRSAGAADFLGLVQEVHTAAGGTTAEVDRVVEDWLRAPRRPLGY